VRNPFVRRHPFGEEELSSYLDRRLSPAESTRLEEHLTSCEPCRRHLEELRAVVEGLRALPSAPAPRSFALRPEQVEAPRRRRPVGPAVWAQRASAFAPAGVAAAALLLFLVLVGVDLGTLGGKGAPESAGMPSTAKEAYQAQQPEFGAAPAPTPAPGLAAPAPAPAQRAATDEGEKAGTAEATAGAPTPTETPSPVAPPEAGGGGGGAGRWVLRGFQGAAGAAFLAAMAALVWQRRRGRGVGHT
jgi:anti-sigma factor RsiW